MDPFFLENKQFYLDSVAKLAPKTPTTGSSKSSSEKSPAESTTANSNTDLLDTTISIRVRPLLAHELAEGHVPGTIVSKSEAGGTVSLHELRKKVVGKPALSVSFISTKRSGTLKINKDNNIQL